MAVVVALGTLAAGCLPSEAPKDAGSGSINVNGDGSVGGTYSDGGIGPRCGAPLYEASPASFHPLPHGNLAVDAQALYWIDEGGRLLRLPKAGGTAQVLATQVAGVSLVARNVALSDDAVYFTDATNVGFIKRVPKTGGDATTLIRTDTTVDEIHLDASWIYWRTRWQAGSPVWRATREGGDPIPLADSLDLTATPYVNDFDIDDDNIYLTVDQLTATDAGAIYRLAKDGSAVTAIATGVNGPWKLTAADPDFLYVGMGRFSDIATQQVHAGKIGRVAKNATAAATLEIVASNQDGPANVVRDGANLYWINFGAEPTGDTKIDSTLMRLALPAAGQDDAADGGAAGSGPASPLSQLAECAWGSQSIAVDDTSVYYLDSYGGVRKVAK